MINRLKQYMSIHGQDVKFVFYLLSVTLFIIGWSTQIIPFLISSEGRPYFPLVSIYGLFALMISVTHLLIRIFTVNKETQIEFYLVVLLPGVSVTMLTTPYLAICLVVTNAIWLFLRSRMDFKKGTTSHAIK